MKPDKSKIVIDIIALIVALFFIGVSLVAWNGISTTECDAHPKQCQSTPTDTAKFLFFLYLI